MSEASEDLPLRPTLVARLRRNSPFLVALGASFAFGAPATRLLESYRGVVLERRGDQVLLAVDDRPPRWVGEDALLPGQIVDKDRGAWHAKPVDAKARDFKLMQMYERYTATYDAVIVRIDPPLSPGQASVAVVDTDQGRRLRVPLWSEALAGAAVGRRVRKMSGAWEPLLLDESASEPPSP